MTHWAFQQHPSSAHTAERELEAPDARAGQTTAASSTSDTIIIPEKARLSLPKLASQSIPYRSGVPFLFLAPHRKIVADSRVVNGTVNKSVIFSLFGFVPPHFSRAAGERQTGPAIEGGRGENK